MTLPKPDKHINWAVGNPDFANRVVEPSNAKKQAAWLDDERPPAPFFNWLYYKVDEWLKYLESKTDAESVGYGAVIGDTGSDLQATHDTLQEANDDGALGTNIRVLVKDSYTINSTISLTKAGWRIDFQPGVVYSKGSATTGLSLEAEGLVLNFGRMTGFTGGGDIAVELTNDGDYCQILGMRFGAGTDTEVDDSAVDAGKKPRIQTLTEV